MDKKTYEFNALEKKYDKFKAPAFTIKIDGNLIDTSRIPVSNLEVIIDAGKSAGGCTFTIRSEYNYQYSKFDEGLLELIKIGKRVQVDIGYVNKKEVFYGLIDNYTVTYDVNSSPSIHVSAIDAKSLLMNYNNQYYFNSKDMRSTIGYMADLCRYALKDINIGNIKAFTAELIVTEQNYCAFLNTLAELCGMFFMVIDGEFIFDDLIKYNEPLIKLEWGVSLMEFSKTLSAASQVEKVSVYSLEHTNNQPVSGQASKVTIYGEGKSASETAEVLKGTELVLNNSFVKNSQECLSLAQNKLNSISLNYVSCEGKCIGIPEIIAGRYIEIDGLNKYADGKYFINRVRHSYDSENGYYTSFECSAPKSK